MKYNDQGFYNNNSDELETENFDITSDPSFEQQLEPPFEQVPYRQSFRQPVEQPAYEQPFGQPSYNQPFEQNFEQPTYNQSFGQNFEQSTYNQPFGQSFEQSTYDQPFGQSFEQPTYDQPFEQDLEQPTYDQSFGQSSEQPLYDQSSEQTTFTNTARASVINELSKPLNPNAEPDNDWDSQRAEERRRAAIRRRKLEAKKRKRQKRIIQAIIRCSILLIIVILILVGIVKMVSGAWKHFQKDKKPDKTVEKVTTTEETTEAPAPKISEKIVAKELPKDKETALAIIQELGEENSDMKSISDNAAVYSEKILQHLAANPEMTEFVLNYPAKISLVFDGNFEVTVSEKKVPLFLQFDERWGYADYGNEIIATNGSAPTCLSMAYTYILQDGTKNPIKVADYAVSKGYLSEEGVTSDKLMTEGATDFGMTSEELPLDKKTMQKALEDGKLIICKMKDGDFTKDVQYILIYKCKDGLFYLNDPSSAARSDLPWAYDRLQSQIDKMWVLGK